MLYQEKSGNPVLKRSAKKCRKESFFRASAKGSLFRDDAEILAGNVLQQKFRREMFATLQKARARRLKSGKESFAL
jgi:hypothetical protein